MNGGILLRIVVSGSPGGASISEKEMRMICRDLVTCSFAGVVRLDLRGSWTVCRNGQSCSVRASTTRFVDNDFHPFCVCLSGFHIHILLSC